MDNLKGELMRLDTMGIKPTYSALSRIYGKDRRTIKSDHHMLKEGIIKDSSKKSKISVLDKYIDIIKEKLAIPGANMKAVYMFLKMTVDEDIKSYSNFRKFVKKMKIY